MASPKLISIERADLVGTRPRNAGSNARLGNHGQTVKEAMARVTFDDGSSGFGFSRITQDGAKALLGKSLDELISVDGGVSQDAWHIEFPLWDTLGNRAGKPVYTLISDVSGAFTAACYDTSLYFDDLHLDRTEDAVDLIVTEAMDGYKRGHRAFKIKVGRGAFHMDLDAGTNRDIAIIKGVRSKVSAGLPIMIDANNGWNYNITQRVLRETAESDVYWMEEAFHEDKVLYGHLKEWMAKENLSVKIADGEGQASPTLMDWVRDGFIDVVQYDIRQIGLSRWLEVKRQLDEWGVGSAPHNYGSGYGNYASSHLAAAIEHFTFVEWDHIEIDGVDASAYSIVEGRVQVPDAAGFGLGLDDGYFQRQVESNGFSVKQ